MSRALVTGALVCVLWPVSAMAGPPERRRQTEDAGRPPPPASDEDREVIENLDLLQSMEDAKDLDLLLELNPEKDGDADGQ